jgi:hypothetical protein
MPVMNDERTFERIAADDHARRELLWLRAKEKGADDVARALERVDPQLLGRLRCAGLDIEERDGESASARAERMGRSWDQCFARHVAAVRRR